MQSSPHLVDTADQHFRTCTLPSVPTAIDPHAAAFTAFVQARGTALARSAYLITGDATNAEDILQTALAETYLRWARLRKPEAAEAYCRKVIVTTNAAWWRRRASRETPHATLPDSVVPDMGGDVVERAALIDALRQLSPRQRAALVCRYFDDLSESQTAEVLGCSAGSVKQHTARGLERLRHLLGDEPGIDMSGQLQLVTQGSSC
jgi:RNA polymerase sigma-70 factor (sigma-E family)